MGYYRESTYDYALQIHMMAVPMVCKAIDNLLYVFNRFVHQGLAFCKSVSFKNRYVYM